MGGLKDAMFGTTGPRGGVHDGLAQSMFPAVTHRTGTQVHQVTALQWPVAHQGAGRGAVFYVTGVRLSISRSPLRRVDEATNGAAPCGS